MSGSPIYCSHSRLPGHHFILVSWGRISQKYSPLYSGLFCRENDLKKRGLLIAFILPVLLSVMNCSFPFFMLLLSSHVTDSPVSPCNVSCAACIFFPQGSSISITCCSPALFLHLQHPLFAAGLALLYVCLCTHQACMIARLRSSKVPSASDWILIKCAVSTHAVYRKRMSAEQQEQCQKKVSPIESILTTS